jgi:benzoyl-CoA reductase/2-hydroxyglutaryl-CoA dehydratase subunit BcrC/BadD/HgdB
VPFNFVPELVHAFESAVPLTSEILSTLAGNASEGKGHRYWDYAMGIGIPDHLCSASTIELGAMLSGHDFEADAIISCTAGACDANSKIHEFVANYLGIPQFILEKPVDDSERGIEQYRRNFYALVEQLEDFLGEKIKEERLREVVEYCNRSSELQQQLWELKKNSPCPVPNIFNMFIYGCRFTQWGRPESQRAMQVMVDEAKKRLAAGEYPAEKEVARCGWLYTSYYIDFGGLFNWMEEQGYTQLFDVLDLFFPEPISTESRESMLDGICLQARTFPMTKQMGAESMSLTWIDDAITMARMLDANCGIFCGHHACKQTWSIISIVQKELMERIGAPVLTLQGDAWLSGMTPTETLQANIDEFIKNVVAKKRRVKPRARAKAEG